MTVAKTVGQQIPSLNLVLEQMNDPRALYRALTNYTKDIESYLRRAVATINENNRGGFQATGTGYLETNSGYLLEWGSTTASSAGVITNFPFAFPNGCQSLVLQLQGAASPAATTLAGDVLSKTQFEAFSSVAGPVNVWFMAMGT